MEDEELQGYELVEEVCDPVPVFTFSFSCDTCGRSIRVSHLGGGAPEPLETKRKDAEQAAREFHALQSCPMKATWPR